MTENCIFITERPSSHYNWNIVSALSMVAIITSKIVRKFFISSITGKEFSIIKHSYGITATYDLHRYNLQKVCLYVPERKPPFFYC